MKRLLKRCKYSFAVLFVISILFACKTHEESVNTARSHTIQIKQMQFQPAELTVHKGDTVIFINNDIVPHDVIEETHKAWASGPMQTGAIWKMVPSDDASYYCGIHVVMKGKIVLGK